MIDLEEIKVDKNFNVPASKHVERFLRSKIKSKELKPGDKLPPKRDFLKKAGVGSKTISEAIEALCKDGLIETSKRGTFVVNNVPKDHFEISKNSVAKNKIMLLTPDVTAYTDSLLLSGIYGALNGSNIEFTSRNIDSTVNKTNLDSALMDMLCEKYSGLILIPPFTYQISDNRISTLQEHGIPVVFCHRKPVGAAGPIITWDWENVGKTAANLFLERNHKKLGYLASIRYKVSEAYEKGFRETLKEHSIILSENNICYGASSHRSIETECEKIDFITELLSGPDRPTAIFCNDASSEVLILMMARKMKIKIPEELSLLRFGTAPHDYNMGNVISSLYVDHKKIGNLAIQTLFEMQTNHRPIDSNETLNVPIKFNESQTLADAPSM